MRMSRRDFVVGGAAAGFYVLTQKRASGAVAEERRISINPDATIAVIRPELHSNFAEHLGSCIYGGIWVGRDSKIPNVEGYRKEAVDYLRALGIPVLRWPGGCFADFYHWRQGIGPAARRPKMVNTSWGGYVEDNSFGTHEFIRFCQLIGSEPYLSVNMGSGSPQEMMEWMEYCNYPAGSTLADERAANGSPEPFRVRYWGIGNENWGCGGGMRPEEYAQQYRQFATYARAYGGTTPFLVACGPSRNDRDWTKTFLTFMTRDGRGRVPAGYAMHFYQRGSAFATKFTPEAMQQQFRLFQAMELAIVDQRELDQRLRSQAEHRLHRGRVGHLGHDGARGGEEVRAPVAADHHALRGGGGPRAQRLPPPRRQARHDQHRADGERAALAAAHREREVHPHAGVLRVRAAEASPRQDGGHRARTRTTAPTGCRCRRPGRSASWCSPW